MIFGSKFLVVFLWLIRALDSWSGLEQNVTHANKLDVCLELCLQGFGAYLLGNCGVKREKSQKAIIGF